MKLVSAVNDKTALGVLRSLGGATMPLSWLWQHRWAIGLFVSVAAGVIYRLIWLQDMEYKEDEAWTFTQVQAFWQTHHLPLIGMPSSAGMPNAGMSFWVFLAISSFLPINDPLALARAVQLMNVVAILLLALFALRSVERSEREPWLWSVALVSVNPLAVLFSRKIWPQDTLPVFTVGMLVGWWYRRRWWGAFLWGLVGAFLGQIHLGGFLFAAAFVACTLLFDRRSVRWFTWFAGSILGALPMVPWLMVAIGFAQNAYDMNQYNPLFILRRISKIIYLFIQHWLSLSLGLDLHYSLGDNFAAFLAYPTIGHTRVYLGAALLGVVILIFSIILVRLAFRFYARPHATIELIFGPRSATTLALNAAFWGYGLLLTATLRPVYLHYLTIAFSLPALWLAWLTRAGSNGSIGSTANSRLLLTGLVLAQACLTITFLAYIHETQFIQGDYGTVYGAQTRHGSWRSDPARRRAVRGEPEPSWSVEASFLIIPLSNPYLSVP